MKEEILKLRDITIKQKELEEKAKNIKSNLEKNYLTEKGYKDDIVSIPYTKSSTTTTLDLIALQEKEPELYEDLLKDYVKVTNKKGYFKYTFK